MSYSLEVNKIIQELKYEIVMFLLWHSYKAFELVEIAGGIHIAEIDVVYYVINVSVGSK